MVHFKKITISIRQEILLSTLVATGVAILFFYKFFLFGQVPFPGDLLIAEYKPWRSYSIAGYNPGSYPNKAQYPDAIRQLYPWKTQVLESLKSGNIPLWNPHNFAGSPLLANFQSASLYPLNAIYFLFSQQTAWAILVVLQPLFASLFTYWYSRSLRLSPLGSTLAGISFGYGTFMNVWLEYNTIGHVLVWLPLGLLSVEHIRARFHPLWFIVLIGSLTLPWYGGHPQIASYIYLFMLLYIAVRAGSKLKLPLLLTCTVLPLGISAAQIIPGLELLSISARSVHPYSFLMDKILIQPWQLIMLIFPDFFGNPATRTYWPTDTYIGKTLSIGLVPLFFTFAIIRSNHALKSFFIICVLAVLLLTTKNPITSVLYRFPIPIISTSSPTLLIFLFQFSLSVLAGIGIDWFIKESHTIKKLGQRTIFVFGGFLITFLIIWVLKHHTALSGLPLEQGYKSLIYAGIISCGTLVLFFAGIRKKSLMLPALVLVVCLHASDLFYGFHKFNPFVPPSLVYPETKIVTFLKDTAGTQRIWGYGTAAIEANLATQLGLYSPDGYDPLYPKWYGEFIHLSAGGTLDSLFTTQTRSDATITTGFGERDLIENTSRLLVLKRLGVGFILDRVENNATNVTFPPDQFTQVYDSEGWRVFEYMNALPKAILASSYSIATTLGDFEKQYEDPSFDPKEQVILESPPNIEPSAGVKGAIVRIDQYLPNNVTLMVSTQAPKILVLSDTYYPGWIAKIDGVQTTILKANHAMRAVGVPAGNHQVQFMFEPASFRIGAMISGVSFLALLLLSVWMYKRYYGYANS